MLKRTANVFINAYLVNNLGDDMFVILLCQRFPDASFFIVCDECYSSVFKFINNLNIISPTEYNKNLLENIIDYQVLIGGSIFMQPQNPNKIEEKFNSVISCRLSSRIPFFVIGANFGPFTEKKHYKLYNKWFSELTDICFRDYQSYKMFCHKNNVRWAPDLLLSYHLPKVYQEKRNIVIVPIYNNGRIGMPNYSNEICFDFFANIAIKYIQLNYKITFASFCNHQLDILAIHHILQRIPQDLKCKISIIKYKYDTNDFLKKFLTAEYVIGTRFHSIILAWKAKIPVFPIVYNAKTSNVIYDYGFKGKYADITQLENLTFDFIDQNRKDLQLFNCVDLASKAEEHFKVLAESID